MPCKRCAAPAISCSTRDHVHSMMCVGCACVLGCSSIRHAHLLHPPILLTMYATPHNGCTVCQQAFGQDYTCAHGGLRLQVAGTIYTSATHVPGLMVPLPSGI